MDLYHALNRGVDKRTIFLDNQDRARFVHDMFAFNSTKRSSNTHRTHGNMFDVGRRTLEIDSETSDYGEKIVDIHAWCLMSNHYHLLLSERVEGGIVSFLKKLNGGYAKYFNERYKRCGTLFQGRTKKILIDSDSHFLHIINYIHLNPLDTLADTANWRELKIENSNNAFTMLQNYRWSSYLDYVGVKNFPSILTTSLFIDVFNHDYKTQIEKYLLDIDTNKITHLMLE